MRLWRWILVLLVAAVAAALAWHWLAADPGSVQIRLRDTLIETSVVVALAALLLVWLVLGLGWRLLRWPLRAWGRASDRRGRERLASGMAAFAEGDYLKAERELAKAAQRETLRLPALLLLARAAHERGADARASEVLGELGDSGERVGAALRARFLVDNGQPREALELLKGKEAAAQLSLRGRQLLVETALALGEPHTALEALPPLVRSQSLTAEAQAQLEQRTLAAALAAAPDLATLNALWHRTSRNQRRQVELVDAFARRSAGLGQMLAAMDEIEAAQRHQWSDRLAAAWGELGPAEAPARLQRAEHWLGHAPNSAPLLLTLARLQLQLTQIERAEESVQRALALAATPAGWELLGEVRRAVGDDAGAANAYANALHAARAEPLLAVAALAPRGAVDTRPIAFEERSEHGVPRLPGGTHP